MDFQFLITVKESGRILQSQKNKFNECIRVLFQHAKTTGLSIDAQKAVIDVALNLNLDDSTFKNLMLCVIPMEVVSKDIVDLVFPWLLAHCYEDSYMEKVSWLLDWVACLLDHKLIDKEAVDQYYSLLFMATEKGWKNVSYILYLLTKREDVTRWRINYLERSHDRFQKPSYSSVLLKRFKELNPDLEHRNILEVRGAIKSIFCDKNKFYLQVKESLSRRNIPLSSASMSVMPALNHKKIINHGSNTILPPIQYLHPNNQSGAFSECRVGDITKGEDLVKNFHKLTLPLNTLSLLNSSAGIHILMMSSRSTQDHFFQNLSILLEENLIYKRSNYSIVEVENLLEKVIQLQQTYNQGFKCVSHVFSVFLQFWDGYQYRSQVYKILEWFVFQFHAELNRFVLLPLHTLCVTGEPDEQSDIILYFLNLIRNLYTRLKKAKQNYKNVFDESDVINTVAGLIPVIKSLTKFTRHLCRLALYIHPCNNQILFASLIFYEEIHELEVRNEMDWWTIISSNVVYHILFSCNAELLNQMCGLWTRYREFFSVLPDDGSVKVVHETKRLEQFAADMFNILWTGQAFCNRTRGHAFASLSSADEVEWRPFVNLNNSLTMERHIMFSQFRMMFAEKINRSWNLLSKNDMVTLLEDQFPELHDVIQKMISG